MYMVRIVWKCARGKVPECLEVVKEVRASWARDGNRTDYFTESDSQIDLPMVVLVNEFSASASEVLSGAFQDHDRAEIVGTKTFGKGSVNLPKKLSDQSALYYSIARWYSPDGNMIEGKGIKPDFTVEAIQEKNPEKDLQLETALKRLTFLIN